MEEKIVISLGGSLIVPDNIDADFLKSFKALILEHVSKGKKFVIITGGGKTCRNYNAAAEKVTNVSKEDLDWLGIAATRLNAELVRIAFGKMAFEKIIMDPDAVPNTDKPIMIGAGWKPGNSSDLAAVHCAISVGAKKIINLSNTDYVYDSDPKINPNAKKIENISWTDYRAMIPKEWNPGLNVPFDPTASGIAEKEGMTVITMNGRLIDNLDKCLNGEKFVGTVIS
jgi:uridylate kinase